MRLSCNILVFYVISLTFVKSIVVDNSHLKYRYHYSPFKIQRLDDLSYYTNSHSNSNPHFVHLNGGKLGRTVRLDPEVYMNVTQLIKTKGYPCETHTVKTPDGFILTLFRIPHGKNSRFDAPRPVVFLQHGLLCSAASWLINLSNESLGYILADQGYDVWLGNIRGSTYSRRHVSLSPDSDEFWNWSMDEMIKYDLPSMVNYTLYSTNQTQLYYIGHSQGTFIGFAKFSQDPSFALKIKRFYALAPVTTVGHTLTPLRLLKYATDTELFDLFGRKDFLPNAPILKFLARTMCKYKYVRGVCVSVIFLFGGIDVKNLNMTRLPVMLSQTPAGTSTTNMIHWLQLIRSYKFQMFDFGSNEENQKHYGQNTPPQYDVGAMTVPVELYTGGHDWLADKEP